MNFTESIFFGDTRLLAVVIESSSAGGGSRTRPRLRIVRGEQCLRRRLFAATAAAVGRDAIDGLCENDPIVPDTGDNRISRSVHSARIAADAVRAIGTPPRFAV